MVRVWGNRPGLSAVRERQVIGTGFFVTVPKEAEPLFRRCYVVTAHHNLEGLTRIEVQAQGARDSALHGPRPAAGEPRRA